MLRIDEDTFTMISGLIVIAVVIVGVSVMSCCRGAVRSGIAVSFSARAARSFASFNAREIGVVLHCAACIETRSCTFSPISTSG